jgi:hypothetical protein
MLTTQRGLMVVAIAAGLFGGAANAYDAKAEKPARVVVFTDTASTSFASLLLKDYAPAEPVVIGERERRAVVVVISPDPDKAPRLLERLFKKEIEGCTVSGGPVTCCSRDTNTDTDTIRVSTERGWVNLGQKCDPVAFRTGGEHGTTSYSPAPSGQGKAKVVPIPHDLSAALFDRAGIDYQFIQTTTAAGAPQVLVSPLRQHADRREPKQPSPETLLARITFSDAPPRLLASHPVQEGECGGPVNACLVPSNDEHCHRDDAHWYFLNRERGGGDEVWCRLATSCGC